MSASSLSDLLASQLPQGLAAHAKALLGTQSVLDRALPAALAGHVRVMQLENGALSLACGSGAVASRLRNQTDALMASLGKHGVAVTSVRVSVNPELLARYVHPVEKAGLPACRAGRTGTPECRHRGRPAERGIEPPAAPPCTQTP